MITYNTPSGVTEELPAGHKEEGKNLGKDGYTILNWRWGGMNESETQITLLWGCYGCTVVITYPFIYFHFLLCMLCKNIVAYNTIYSLDSL